MLPNRVIHYASGLLIAAFVVVHLFNHLVGLYGAEAHIQLMATLRKLYRNPFAETLLMGAVLVQISTGIGLWRALRHQKASNFERLHRWSGLYLAVFLAVHLSAVWGGRLVLGLDTNFYFGVAGLNTFPFNLFFVPYYTLAVLSFFAHVAAVHRQKMPYSVLGLSPEQQAFGLLVLGGFVTFLILYGLTGGFGGVAIPSEYLILVGK